MGNSGPIGPLFAAVDASINAAVIRDQDAGTAELARHYASLIDQAKPGKKYTTAVSDLRRALDMLAEFEPLAAARARSAYTEVLIALAEHSVMSDLGPKLLAALTALGLTPASSQPATTPVKGGSNSDSTGHVAPAQESQFERARRERAERRAGAH